MSVDLAYLEDCTRTRPAWSPQDGVASPAHEAVVILATPLGILWLTVLGLFIWKRNILSGLLVAVFSSGYAGLITLEYELNDALFLGRLGGCVGSVAVARTVLLGISAFATAFVVLRLYGLLKARKA